jgi:hypothetical protein
MPPLKGKPVADFSRNIFTNTPAPKKQTIPRVKINRLPDPQTPVCIKTLFVAGKMIADILFKTSGVLIGNTNHRETGAGIYRRPVNDIKPGNHGPAEHNHSNVLPIKTLYQGTDSVRRIHATNRNRSKPGPVDYQVAPHHYPGKQ